MRNRTAGFSALELVVVVAIAGGLLAWSYPRLAALSTHYRLDGAAWNLAAVLQKTRLRAIGEGNRFRVVFDSAQRTYQIQKETTAGSNVFANDGVPQAIDDSGSIAVTTDKTPVFTTRGALEVGTECVVRLAAASGAARIVAAQLGGRVVVQ